MLVIYAQTEDDNAVVGFSASSSRLVRPIRGSVEGDLAIKPFEMKLPRPHILDWVKDQLDVNL